MTRILYLHGFASSPQSTKAVYFREGMKARGVDLEVLDLAEGNFEHLTITGQLGVIGRAARGERVSLIGSSMGGYLAALYAASHPEVERLVLLAPAFEFTRRWRDRLGAEGLDDWRHKGSIAFYHYGYKRECPLSYQLLEDAAQYPDFPDFRQPALIFHGWRDETVPASSSEHFAAEHANVRLELLESGHELTDVMAYMFERAVEFLSV